MTKRTQRHRRLFGLTTTCVVAALTVAIPTPAGAIDVSKCKTINQTRTATVKGKRETYICTASGKSKVWRVKSTKSTLKSVVVWRDSGNRNYFADGGTPPKCQPISWVFPITDISSLVGVLYPGQHRGGDYKAHGGFSAATNTLQVVSPISGYITSGSAYREMGEVQYMVDIQDPCGIAVRLDHLFTLEGTTKRLFDKQVTVREDSRGTFFNPPIAITAGEVVATTVGFVAANNTNFDFGAYDFRKIQPSKRTQSELATFGPAGTLGKYGLCMLALFGSSIESHLRALPSADKTTDYC